MAAGGLAFLVYVLTLSRGAYPGASAALVAGAAHLVPGSLSAHPLWSLLTDWLARLPVWTLPARLNLFSAVCGAAAVGLLGHLVEQWIFMAAFEKGGGTAEAIPLDTPADEADDRPAEEPDDRPPNAATALHNLRAASAARLGGWVAALALAFAVPFWAAATRLHFQTFDLLLVLLAELCTRLHRERPSHVRAYGVALLCGLGVVETPAFILFAPLLFLRLLAAWVATRRSWEWRLAVCAVIGVTGAAASLLLLVNIRAADAAFPVALRAAVGGLVRSHFVVLRHALPTYGWVWFVLLAFAPALVVLSAAKRAFAERTVSHLFVHLALTVAAGVCLFNAAVSPWGLARDADRLPVMASLAVAVVTGYLAAYWRMLSLPAGAVEALADPGPARAESFGRWLAGVLRWPVAAAVVLAAAVNLGEARGSKGAFADRVAGEVLDRLGARNWIVSGGLLDNHLLIGAHERGRTLRLVGLADGTDAAWQRRLLAMVDSEPVLAARRASLQNAMALGPMAFAQEWLAGDPAAEERLLVVGVPEVWTMAGRRPVPDGFGFTGVKDIDRLRGTDLVAANRAVWDRLARTLAPDARLPGTTARFLGLLRSQAGLAANNLGVLLEDLAQPGQAYEAYAAALRIEPENLSALINQHALTLGGVHAGEREAIETRLKARARRSRDLPSLMALMRLHGEVRQPETLQQNGRVWALMGQPVLARSQLDRALALAPKDTDARGQLAALAAQQGHVAEAEQAYRAVLSGQADNAGALLGLAALALEHGRGDEAQAWIDRARQAGASDTAVALAEVTRLSVSGRSDEALDRLRTLTDGGTRNLELLSMLADLLLRRGETGEVEKHVLPGMLEAAGRRDHVLVHLVRARLLRTKQPVDRASAQAALRHATRLRPDLPQVWDELLDLDFSTHDVDACERDASDALRALPAHAFANYVLGTVQLARGELRRAEDLFRRSLSQRRTLAAYNDLAETLRLLRQLGPAEEAARAGLALDDSSYAAWDTLGCILLDVGKPDAAAQAIERSLALCATDPRIHLSMARARAAQGRGDESRTILESPVFRTANVPPDVRREADDLARQLGPVAPAREL